MTIEGAMTNESEQMRKLPSTETENASESNREERYMMVWNKLVAIELVLVK